MSQVSFDAVIPNIPELVKTWKLPIAMQLSEILIYVTVIFQERKLYASGDGLPGIEIPTGTTFFNLMLMTEPRD